MTMTDLISAQLTDPFRIGLIAALLYTTLRTRGVTGLVVPLLAGITFVAAMLPMTMGRASETAVPLWQEVAAGLVANAILLGLCLLVWTLVQRLRGVS
jgi:hypothetical protein